jgi:hypothetical protein
MAQPNQRRLDILLDAFAAITNAIVAMRLYEGEYRSEITLREDSFLTNSVNPMKINGNNTTTTVNQNNFGYFFK